MRCPCAKKSETRSYAECCGRFHSGGEVAPTAEALMRSRYSAFAMKNGAYLEAAWHTSTRPSRLLITPHQTWLGLQIVAAATDGDAATVEFKARSRTGGRTQVMHEVSRFVREGGRWYYLDGLVR